MAWLFGAIAAASFLVTAASIPLVARIARRTGFLDLPGPRKIHSAPVPYGGGLAVAAGFFLPVLAGAAGACLVDRGWALGLPADIRDLAPGVLSRLPQIVVFLAGGLVVLVLGLVDDKRKLSARFKLAVQTLVAVGFVLGAERLDLFWERSAWGDLLGGAVTVLWIVGVTNAFNLLDHMDGISGGIAAISAAAFAAVALWTGQHFLAASLLALVGACAAFLCFNFPPARIFLGDAGSLLIGYLLAALTVVFTFYERGRAPLHAYFVPLAVLAVPIFDTVVVVLIRMWRRRPLFLGDRNHLAHRLLALGLSRRACVLAVYAITTATSLAALMLYEVSTLTGALLIMGQIAVLFAVVTLLEFAARGRDAAETPGA